MPTQELTEPGRVAVLAVTPFEEDRASLQEIFRHSNWNFERVDSCAAARNLLRTIPVHVVICERTLADGCWRDLLDAVSKLPDPPHLIVASSSADDRLWSEVLNLGGYDILQKPFNRQEVFRVTSLAWRHWREHPLCPLG